jgi:fibronectin-binding autotransporter adhesin
MSTLTAADFLAYNPEDASTIEAGPLALYSVSPNSILPTQMNEGFTEVDAKAAGFDLLTSLSAVESDLSGDIEPVVIGPGGQLYLLDGNHTFTALLDSAWGADPNLVVYVNVIANYSNLTESEFLQTMQESNLLLPLNDGVPQTVNDATGAPIPTILTELTSDVYRGLEYSILKEKDSKLFTTTSNITGAKGASTPGLDKMTGFYSDFLEAAAYQNANGGLGLPYLSPGDIALATQWNLAANSTTTLPNVSDTVAAAQLPGFILSQNLVEGSGSASNTVYFAPGGISNATLASGALAGNGTFTGITEINAGTASNPIMIGTPNVGLILQLGNNNDTIPLAKKSPSYVDAVTLTGTNTYTGGISILAGMLIVQGDTSLGATPTESNANFLSGLMLSAGVPINVLAAVQADNGIIFNSLTEGNGTLTIGTTTGGAFTTSRPIAIGSEAATINVNGNTVTLNGSLITLGYDGVGIGQTSGFSPLTIDDDSVNGGKTATAGTLILSTSSPYFYGDIIIGNNGTPTVEVTSTAAQGWSNTALGNTTGPAAEIGELELNGGTLKTGTEIVAPERDIVLDGGSQIDLDGNTSTWGTLTDVKRTIAIGDSSSTPGSITFSSFTISQTATLQLDGSANGTTYSGNETVTFTNGIVQTAPQDTLILNPSSLTALGTTERVINGDGTSTLVNDIAPVWIVTNEGNLQGVGPYDFVSYGANGYTQVSATVSTYSTTLDTSPGSAVVELAANTSQAANVYAYALNTNGYNITLGTGDTLTIGDSTDPAGLILDPNSSQSTTISGGTLAFGGSQGVIWLGDSAGSTISSAITGTGGLTFAGGGSVTLSGSTSGVSGQITIDSGTVTLAAANMFANDVAGVELGDVKTHPAPSTLDLTASNAFTTLNSVGSKSAINLSSGATLTIGDPANNLSSTLSSTITENGNGVAGALTKDGSGLLDISGASVSFASGGTVVVNGGVLRIGNGVFGASATNVITPRCRNRVAIFRQRRIGLQRSDPGGGDFPPPCRHRPTRQHHQ